MSVQLKNNQLFKYVLVLMSLFILVLFTKDQVMNLQFNMDQKESLSQELTQARETQQKLQKIASEVEQEDSITHRYLHSFTEDDMLTYFYSYADQVNSGSGMLMINSISISESTENQLGFNETSINVNAQVSDTQVMKAFLDYLISDDAKYKFFIESYFYPNDGREGNFNMQLPLKIFSR